MADKTTTIDDQGIVTDYQVEDGKVHHTRWQDVEPFIKSAAEQRAQYGEFQKSREGLGDKVASFPVVVVEKWMHELGFNWFTASKEERAEWLKTEHAAPFLTKPMRRR